MREIKFRSWQGNKKEPDFVYFNLFNAEEFLNPFWNTDIQQFTGLKDKNGKEIYEGDIVEYKMFQNENPIIGEVKYSEKSATFYVSRGENFRLINSRDEIEVIGNIYEGVLPKYENTDIMKQCPRELKDFKKDTKLVEQHEEKSV